MATTLQRYCILSTLLLGFYLCPPANSQQEHRTLTSTNPAFAREMMQSMAKMDREMMTAPMTGDPDHDFAAMMIPTTREPWIWRKSSCCMAKTLSYGDWLKRSLSHSGRRSKSCISEWRH